MALIRIFLTGEPGSGKTTAIRKISQTLQNRGTTVGGMISSEIRENGRRIGFGLEDVSSHKVGILAQSNQKNPANPTVGRYAVNLVDLDGIGVGAIKRALNDADVVIVDEIGPMELKSQEFVLAIEAVLASKKHVLGTLHKRAHHHLLNAIRSNYRIIDITPTNRDRITLEIIAEFL